MEHSFNVRNTIGRYEIVKRQNSLAFLHNSDSYRNYYVHGISRYSIVKKSCTTGIWGKCSRRSKCPAAFYDHVPSFCNYYTVYHQSNRKTIIIGTVISLIGSVGLLIFHSTKPEVSIIWPLLHQVSQRQ